jgi:hypothetical protein
VRPVISPDCRFLALPLPHENAIEIVELSSYSPGSNCQPIDLTTAEMLSVTSCSSRRFYVGSQDGRVKIIDESSKECVALSSVTTCETDHFGDSSDPNIVGNTSEAKPLI